MQNLNKKKSGNMPPIKQLLLSQQLLYIAHPYSGDIENNMASVIEKTNELLDRGFKVFCPLTHSHWLDLGKKREPEFWYDLDITLMEKCDGIVLCPGWEQSRGCILEYGFFTGAKKPVYLYTDLIKP